MSVTLPSSRACRSVSAMDVQRAKEVVVRVEKDLGEPPIGCITRTAGR